MDIKLILENHKIWLKNNWHGSRANLLSTNFGTLEYIKVNYSNSDICIPYNTDGKARCGYLQLIRKLEK